MRTGKIARLPNDIREQLNRRLKNGEEGKSLLKWLNSLPEVKAILDAHFDGRPIAPSNLTEWKDGGYRDWQVRQDALAMVANLQDESALGDKALTSAFNDKLAQWVSIHYAATAQALLASQLDPETKWSRLRNLSADVSRLRRGDVHAERLNIDRQWLALEQSKTEQQREKDFESWLKRPDIQARFNQAPRRGLTENALRLVDNYLMKGISPLDPDLYKEGCYMGEYAVHPPVGCEPKPPQNPENESEPDDSTTGRQETLTSSETASGPASTDHKSESPNGTSRHGQAQVLSRNRRRRREETQNCQKQNDADELAPSSPSPSLDSLEEAVGERRPLPSHCSPDSVHSQTPAEIDSDSEVPKHRCESPNASSGRNEAPAPLHNSDTPSLPSATTAPAINPAIHESINPPIPSPSEPCPKCHREQLPLTPEGKRPFHGCWFCFTTLYDPGTEFCPGCREALPALAPNGQRPYSDCRLCGFLLPPPTSRSSSF